MNRLHNWMNDQYQIYKYRIENNKIFIYNYKTNEHIATVEKNLNYILIKKIEIIKDSNDLDEWQFLQLTNSNLIRILSTI